MSIVAVVSMKGGVGKTSTTANLAAAMADVLGEGRVSVVDLDPQNALHLHFGVSDAQSPGACRQSLAAGSWRGVMVASEHGVRCLPYGTVSERERLDFERLLHREPKWVGDQIRSAGLDSDAIVLIDTPPGPSVYLKQVLACADIVLVVLLPDAASYATVPVMEAWLAEAGEERPHLQGLYVINQVDRTELLNRDASDLLQQQLQGRVAAVAVHADEAVREALAFQEPVLAYAPHGQASHDLANLANALIDTLSR